MSEITLFKIDGKEYEAKKMKPYGKLLKKME